MVKLKLYLILLSLPAFCISQSVDISYNKLNGHLQDVYSPGVGINYESGYHGIFGVGFKYFTPKADTFYFQDQYSPYGKGVGKISYKNYFMIPVYLKKDYNIYIGDKSIIQPGFQIGLTYLYYTYSFNNYYMDSGDEYIGGTLSFGPRLKYLYDVNDNYDIYIKAKYKLVSYFNYDVHRFYSIGLGIYFK